MQSLEAREIVVAGNKYRIVTHRQRGEMHIRREISRRAGAVDQRLEHFPMIVFFTHVPHFIQRQPGSDFRGGGIRCKEAAKICVIGSGPLSCGR
jgi:hypothetical protein